MRRKLGQELYLGYNIPLKMFNIYQIFELLLKTLIQPVGCVFICKIFGEAAL